MMLKWLHTICIIISAGLVVICSLKDLKRYVMKNKLFIIGNGFDLAHNLPTRFNPDFKLITDEYEQQNFWDLYQSREEDIWSDFENLLRYPDFNTLEDIFCGYEPDYWSDRESDRNSIIFQVDLNGKLLEALYEFADNAEDHLCNTQAIDDIERILALDGFYLSFNYTHTLENIYGVSDERILHIHGEVGKNNLILGYPKGEFAPEKYAYDVRGKGSGPYINKEVEDYINEIEDYYERTAYEKLLYKCKSFYKETRIDLLKSFLDKNHCKIEEIIVYGHSCAIDFDYFSYLNSRYSNALWKFYVREDNQKSNVFHIIKEFNIEHADIVEI